MIKVEVCLSAVDIFELQFENQPVVFANAGKMIGNAVPVRLGEMIGTSILEHLEENSLAIP